MTTSRTDVHRPSFLDPAEYVEVGYVDNHPEAGGAWMNHEAIGDAFEFEGNYTSRGRCDHCGAGPLRYAVIFKHQPSNQTVAVGERCAGILNLSSRSERERRELLEQAILRVKHEEWLAASPDNQRAKDFLLGRMEAGDYGYEGFYHSLTHKMNRYGSLTENQVAAALRAADRQAERDERRAAEAAAIEGPLVEGRREIEGEILSTKWQDSQYGGAMKMLVRQDDGNKVWGTIPQSLMQINDAGGSEWPDRGARVSFTAQVTRSNDDEHFGFFKRPTNARLVAPVAA